MAPTSGQQQTVAGVGQDAARRGQVLPGLVQHPRLASASADRTVRLWPAFPDAVSALCAKLTTNMNHQQWNTWVSPDIDYITVCPDLPAAR